MTTTTLSVAAIRAKEAFAEAHEEVMVATAMGYVADILQHRGETDEALRIRREEQLPVYERMGLARDLAIGRANLALMLIQRGESGDREEAARLLKLALEATQSMGLPEAEPIRDLLARPGEVQDPNEAQPRERTVTGESSLVLYRFAFMKPIRPARRPVATNCMTGPASLPSRASKPSFANRPLLYFRIIALDCLLIRGLKNREAGQVVFLEAKTHCGRPRLQDRIPPIS